jgi:hypothetical protein
VNLEPEITHDEPVDAGHFANAVFYSANIPCISAKEHFRLLPSLWYLRNLARSSSPDRIGEKVDRIGLGQRFKKPCQSFR